MGGGIFTLGSVLVLSVGLPEARWFILGAALAAVPVAGVLAAWPPAAPLVPSALGGNQAQSEKLPSESSQVTSKYARLSRDAQQDGFGLSKPRRGQARRLNAQECGVDGGHVGVVDVGC